MKDKIKIGLRSYLSLLAISVNVLNIKEILNFNNLTASAPNVSNFGLLMNLIIFIFFYIMYFRFYKKSCWQINVLSILFSIFMIFGNSYMEVHNTGLIFGNIIMNIGVSRISILCGVYLSFF